MKNRNLPERKWPYSILYSWKVFHIQMNTLEWKQHFVSKQHFRVYKKHNVNVINMIWKWIVAVFKNLYMVILKKKKGNSVRSIDCRTYFDEAKAYIFFELTFGFWATKWSQRNSWQFLKKQNRITSLQYIKKDLICGNSLHFWDVAFCFNFCFW